MKLRKDELDFLKVVASGDIKRLKMISSIIKEDYVKLAYSLYKKNCVIARFTPESGDEGEVDMFEPYEDIRITPLGMRVLQKERSI